MLVLDSHWMPLATPDTADAMNAMVRSTMIETRTVLPTLSTQPLNSSPAPICSAPRPSDAAEPKRVAKIARMSMTRPAGPSERRWPMSGANAAEMSCERPLRKVPYAIAMPTTA
jgi:hypothetical protein